MAGHADRRVAGSYRRPALRLDACWGAPARDVGDPRTLHGDGPARITTQSARSPRASAPPRPAWRCMREPRGLTAGRRRAQGAAGRSAGPRRRPRSRRHRRRAALPSQPALHRRDRLHLGAPVGRVAQAPAARDRAPDFGSLDAEIAAARADGMKVMLTSWRYPRWANGPRRARRKDLTFSPPDDLSEDSPFGRWMAALGERDVDAIEVVNEPNFQLWPQRDVHVAVARMMATARAVLPTYGLLVGPATADRRGSSPRHRLPGVRDARCWTSSTDRLRAGRADAWSHHNYGDVESDGATASPRSGDCRRALAGRADPGDRVRRAADDDRPRGAPARPARCRRARPS